MHLADVMVEPVPSAEGLPAAPAGVLVLPREVDVLHVLPQVPLVLGRLPAQPALVAPQQGVLVVVDIPVQV